MSRRGKRTHPASWGPEPINHLTSYTSPWRHGPKSLKQRQKGNVSRRDYGAAGVAQLEMRVAGEVRSSAEQNKEKAAVVQKSINFLGCALAWSFSLRKLQNKREHGNRNARCRVEPLHLLAPAPRGGVSPPSSAGHEAILVLARLLSLSLQLPFSRIVARGRFSEMLFRAVTSFTPTRTPLLW